MHIIIFKLFKKKKFSLLALEKPYPNLSYFWNTLEKPRRTIFSPFSFRATLYFYLMNALVYVKPLKSAQANIKFE